MSLHPTPLKVVYGIDPSEIKYDSLAIPLNDLDAYLLERNQIPSDLHTVDVQAALKASEDRKRRDVQLKVGDMLFLKIHPYQMKTLSKRDCLKLAPNFFRHYKVP